MPALIRITISFGRVIIYFLLLVGDKTKRDAPWVRSRPVTDLSDDLLS